MEIKYNRRVQSVLTFKVIEKIRVILAIRTLSYFITKLGKLAVDTWTCVRYWIL